MVSRNIHISSDTKISIFIGSKCGMSLWIWSSTFTSLQVKVKEIFLQSVYFSMTFIHRYRFVLYYNYSIPILRYCEDVQNCLQLQKLMNGILMTTRWSIWSPAAVNVVPHVFQRVYNLLVTLEERFRFLKYSPC